MKEERMQTSQAMKKLVFEKGVHPGKNHNNEKSQLYSYIIQKYKNRPRIDRRRGSPGSVKSQGPFHPSQGNGPRLLHTEGLIFNNTVPKARRSILTA